MQGYTSRLSRDNVWKDIILFAPIYALATRCDRCEDTLMQIATQAVVFGCNPYLRRPEKIRVISLFSWYNIKSVAKSDNDIGHCVPPRRKNISGSHLMPTTSLLYIKFLNDSTLVVSSYYTNQTQISSRKKFLYAEYNTKYGIVWLGSLFSFHGLGGGKAKLYSSCAVIWWV